MAARNASRVVPLNRGDKLEQYLKRVAAPEATEFEIRTQLARVRPLVAGGELDIPGHAQNYRNCSREACLREIDHLRATAEKLKRRIERGDSTKAQELAEQKLFEASRELHQTTIDHLANSGLNAAHRLSAVGSLLQASGCLEVLDLIIESTKRGADLLRSLPENVPVEQRPCFGGTPGRPDDQLALILTRTLCSAFEKLSRRTATITVHSDRPGSPAGGGFPDLVRDVLDLAGIQASAEAFARRVISEKRHVLSA